MEATQPLSKELIKEIKKEGFTISKENPLTIVNNDDAKEIFSGVAAFAILEDLKSESSRGNIDFKELKKLGDDEMLLVTADVNYADSFNLKEWKVFSVGDFKDVVKKLKDYDDEIECPFGSNESLEFEDGNDLLGNLSFQRITQEEAYVLNDLFCGTFDGGSGVFDEISALGEDEDDEDDNFFDKEETRSIEKLQKYGWTIEIEDEENYLIKATDKDGNISITNTELINSLIAYYRKHNDEI